MQKVIYQSKLIMNELPNLTPSPPSGVSQQKIVHNKSMKDRKHHAPKNHATTTISILSTPQSLSINYTQKHIPLCARKSKERVIL